VISKAKPTKRVSLACKWHCRCCGLYLKDITIIMSGACTINVLYKCKRHLESSE
jgi:hypothetical protein